MAVVKKLLSVNQDMVGKRLDVFVAQSEVVFSREQAQRLIKENNVLLNGAPAKAHDKVKAGDKVSVEIPEPEKWEVVGQAIKLSIAYEDKDIVVVDKPSGMVTHPAVGHPKDTLVNALVHHCKDLAGIGGKLRPGLVHRLDKDTSGLLCVAKTEKAYASLQEQLKTREMSREYLAVVHGLFSEVKATIRLSLGRAHYDRKKFMVSPGKGREAVTHFEVLEQFPRDASSFLRVKLETGRTHQIRVHLSYLKHPVWGDVMYGRGKTDKTRMMLHAARLGLNHPRTGKRLTLESEMPKEMKDFLEEMRRES